MPSENAPIAGGNFPLTRWSMVAAVRSDDPAERARALDRLCDAYWKPVYKYIRLKYSKAPDEAQDLTQGFFAEVLERDLLSRFDPAKSRLRTYMRLCADSFVLNATVAQAVPEPASFSLLAVALLGLATLCCAARN